MDKKQLESLIAEVEARMLEFRKIRALYNVDSQKYYYFHGKISECEFIVDKIRNILKLGKENP